MTDTNIKNPLGEKPVKELLKQFALPSIVAMLVGSLYNIVDQFFIGQSVGPLGNAATTIAYPLTICCIAIALLFGIGGASAFNLAMGMEKKDEAPKYIGNAALMMFIFGSVLAFFSIIFDETLLTFFGSPEDVLPYAKTYLKITAFGFPFLILSSGGGHFIRADGMPRYSMIVNLTGAVINTVLDAIFVFGLNLGIKGAAFATILGQFVAGFMVVIYLMRFKTVHISLKDLIPDFGCLRRVMSLGAASMINQIAMMFLQIVLNKSLKHYGALSVYGDSIPIALFGILNKTISLVMAVIIGISQGLQPIVGFNYGAKKYDRVKNGYNMAIFYGAIVSVIAFAVFMVFPRQIIGIFGDGSDEYFEFGIMFLRTYFFFTFTYFMQPITSNFFTSIGKPKKGIFLALTRQILFLLPLVIILPLFFGIHGIMYAGMIADFTAFIVNVILIKIEFSRPEFKSQAS